MGHLRCVHHTRRVVSHSALTVCLWCAVFAALLTTTNASCAVLVRGGAVTCARGTLSAGALAGGLAGLATKLAPALAALQTAGTPGAVQVRNATCTPFRRHD